MYALVVGEIGFDRKAFLHDLKLWEINAIIKGYRKRAHTHWEVARWQTFCILCALGSKGMSTPEDLMRFPWEEERDTGELPSDEEVERIRKELQQLNAAG